MLSLGASTRLSGLTLSDFIHHLVEQRNLISNTEQVIENMRTNSDRIAPALLKVIRDHYK